VYIGNNINVRLKPLYSIDIEKILKLLLIISIITTALSWYLTIKYYGSIEYIILHSFDIRTETIGDGLSLVPSSITYLNSFQYYAFVLSLTVYSIRRKRKFIYYVLLFFLMIVISDLRSFGRIGILFSIFSIISWMLYNNIRIFSIKKIASVLFLYFVLMLPRLIRGGFDNFSSSINNYSSSFIYSIPSFLYGPVTVYIYYFSSLYAFDAIISSDIIHSMGMRNFAPIANALNNCFHLDARVVLIADSVHIPFEYNIYHIMGELFFDFSYYGIAIFPIIFGVFIGYIFRQTTFSSNIIKIFMMTWIFYTPIYNIFSFGSFFISLLFAYFIFLFFDLKYES
jgi:oligosaccharide repeat unit polymerase